MDQGRKHQHALKYFSFLTTLVFAISLVACNHGEIQNSSNENPKSSFQLFIFSNAGMAQLSHDASQIEYQDWLNKIDLNNTQFNLDNSSISSFTSLGTVSDPNLSLTLNISASQNITKFLEPNSDIDSILSGEYSLGCSVKDEKAFLIVIQSKRVAGGTLRCPTQMGYTHPEMFTVSQQGKVLLKIRNTSTSVIDEIVSSLGS